MSSNGFEGFFAGLAEAIKRQVRKDRCPCDPPAFTAEDREVIASLNRFARGERLAPAKLENAISMLTTFVGQMANISGEISSNGQLSWGPAARKAIALVGISIGLHRSPLSTKQRERVNKAQSLFSRMGAREIANALGKKQVALLLSDLPATGMWWDVR